MVPVERDFIKLQGPDAVSYLQGQCSQDVAALDVGGTADSLLLEPQGRVDALVRVTRTGQDEVVLDTDAGFGERAAERLERFKLRVQAEISPLNWRCIAIRGPESEKFASRAGRTIALPWRWPGVRGLDLVGPEPEPPGGVEKVSRDAWEAVRIEAGIPSMGAEIDEKTIPEEAGVVGRTVSFTKGCYTGQELVARIDSRGSNVARRLRLLVARGVEDAHSVPPGSELTEEATERGVGRVTSVAWSPREECVVALGYVHRSVRVPGTVLAGGERLEVHEPAQA